MLRALIVVSGMAALLPAQVPDSFRLWNKPFPAHRIIGNVHYVGTADLACFLITTPEGHILINTGMPESTPLIRKSIRDLGFRLEDVKILLNMQAHKDHVGAFGEIQKLTKAKVYATEGDAPLLADGGKSDFRFGGEPDFHFAPVKVDRVLRDGDYIEVGGTRVKLVLTPGHTKGSGTYVLSVSEGGRPYTVCMANMGTINPGVKLVNNPKYPRIADDYARTFRVQKELPCEVFLSAHASMYKLGSKYKAGDKYDPARFVVPRERWLEAVGEYENRYRKQLAEEKQQK
jgi:metallo-beta-lactamase class B